MRTVAMYLPQFYQTKKNDEWWGKGFTDWQSCSSAVPLFEGHYQPHVPNDDYYYDLLKKETMLWQAELMKKYEVDGVCMYHYYFKDGERILEKPAENLLKWKEIAMPYCFCWANASWARTWSKIKNKNVWSPKAEEEMSCEGEEILMLQDYGGEKEWVEHFEYLLPFFKDSRYICVDNKPVFLIYTPEDIYCITDMLDCFRKLALQNGLEGIYFIQLARQTSYPCFDAGLMHAPKVALLKYNQRNKLNNIKISKYDEIWTQILNNVSSDTKMTYYGGFVGYDDSPRQGSKGNVVVGGTPEKFGYYLPKLMAKNEVAGNDITFINAWNEWGEGMHLEPDEKFGAGYLQQIPHAKATYQKYTEEFKQRMNSNGKYIQILREDYQSICKNAEKTRRNIEIMDSWMTFRETGVKIADYLAKKGYQRVLIYGYALLGRHLLSELMESQVKVIGIVDQRKEELALEDFVQSYYPTDVLPDCDAVVVCSVAFYDEIRELLKKKGVKKVVAFHELIQELVCKQAVPQEEP